jgi:hypothetical protein
MFSLVSTPLPEPEHNQTRSFRVVLQAKPKGLLKTHRKPMIPADS